MTKADAIYYLKWLKDEAINDADSHRCEALNMAIEALEGIPKEGDCWACNCPKMERLGHDKRARYGERRSDE